MGSRGLRSNWLLRLLMRPLFRLLQKHAKTLAKKWLIDWSLGFISNRWPHRLGVATQILKGV